MASIRELREGKGWTQEELAQHAGLTAATISRLENAHHPPQKSTLRLIALALGVNAQELIESYRNKPVHE